MLADEFMMIDSEGNEIGPGARVVFEKAAMGDDLAISVLNETAHCLALLCINICRVVDPDVIFFSGGMANAGDDFLDKIKSYIAKRTWSVLPTDVKLVLAEDCAGGQGNIFGAALAAEMKFKKSGEVEFDDMKFKKKAELTCQGEEKKEEFESVLNNTPQSHNRELKFGRAEFMFGLAAGI